MTSHPGTLPRIRPDCLSQTSYGQIMRTDSERRTYDVSLRDNKWVRLLAYVTGLGNQKLLIQNEYFSSRKSDPSARICLPVCLSDPERSTLAG